MSVPEIILTMAQGEPNVCCRRAQYVGGGKAAPSEMFIVGYLCQYLEKTFDGAALD